MIYYIISVTHFESLSITMYQAHETEYRNVNELSIKIASFFQCIEEPYSVPHALNLQLTPKGPNPLIG